MNSKQKKAARRREQTTGRKWFLARTRSAVTAAASEPSTSMSQRILSPTAVSIPGPLQHSYPDTIHEPLPPMPQYPEFNFPLRTSDEAVEQEMLDTGALTGEDLDIQGSYSGMFPNLGPNIHDPRELLAYVNHHDVLNAATARGAVPLTSKVAFAPPPKSFEEALMEREMRRAFEEGLSGAGDDSTEVDGKRQGQEDHEQESDSDSGTEGGEFWRFDYRDDEDNFDDENEDDEEMLSEDGRDSGDGEKLPDEMDQDGEPPTTTAEFLVSVDPEDSPDPFAPETLETASTDVSGLPPHILSIYCLVAWLHAQFHLPRAACNALLACLACLVYFLAPQVDIPYITLKSANRAIGLTDIPIHILAVCPGCKEVFPSTPTTPDKCTKCAASLFSDVTLRGNTRKDRTPLIKYPYLSISEQLSSILALPGIMDVMDDWRKVKRTPGHYQDIFDGRIAQTINGHDGKLFFSNNAIEPRGPNGELRLGVNWGVDW